jgi:transposase InsO family protein
MATVIDVYTREIVGWHIANHHTTSLNSGAYGGMITTALGEAIA